MQLSCANSPWYLEGSAPHQPPAPGCRPRAWPQSPALPLKGHAPFHHSSHRSPSFPFGICQTTGWETTRVIAAYRLGKRPSRVRVHCEGCGVSPLQPALDIWCWGLWFNCFLIVLSAGRSLGSNHVLLWEVHGAQGKITAKNWPTSKNIHPAA